MERLKEKSYNNDMGKLNIVSGNILDNLDNKDLIVNSANKYMICGSGVCGAIYKKANKELLEDYCKKHYKENMGTYEIRFSPGFDLGIDILHIYCPKYYDYKDHNEAIEDLLFCYYKIILEAKNNFYKSIISVSLGTGIHGYKHNDIAKQVVERLDYLSKRYDIDFTLVLPNEDIEDLYIKELSNIKVVDDYLGRIEDTAETLRHPNVVSYKKVSDEQIKRAKERLKITKEEQKKYSISDDDIRQLLIDKYNNNE